MSEHHRSRPAFDIYFEIPGTPVSLWRPRSARSREDDDSAGEGRAFAESGDPGRKVIVYDGQKKQRGAWRREASLRMGLRELIVGPVSLLAVFHFPLPHKHLSRALSDIVFHTTVPDTSNCLKWVEDCLNGIAWRDDACVVESYARKQFCPPGLERTSVWIRRLRAEDFQGWLVPEQYWFKK